ncbi:MAG: 30S ribosomal protein S1, partial [Acidimicrobiales bacterium]
IIDLDLQRRRISLSIKQAAEGGVVAAEYQEHFGEHAYDDQGNYIGAEYSEAQEAWEEYFAEQGVDAPVPGGTEEELEAAAAAEPAVAPAEDAEPAADA